MKASELARRVLAGEPRALARAISLAEERAVAAPEVLREIFPATGRAHVIGVTGFPGAGKSSLVDCLTTAYRAGGRTVGVIAVDPSSAFSGGAILGDRIRMMRHSLDPSVFIRSMATRGTLGGLSRATADTIDLLDASGHDVILVETVGVGQDEIDIVRTADTVLVVLVPGMGDDIQAIKAGILEIADVFVINKADSAGTDRLQAELETMMSLGESAGRTEIIRTVAIRDEGTAELLAAVGRHRAGALESGAGRTRKRRQSLERFLGLLRERLLETTLEKLFPGDQLERTAGEIAERKLDPYAATERILQQIRTSISPGVVDVVSSRKSRAGGRGRLDHVGVAVKSLAEKVPLYRDLLGVPLLREEVVETERVRVAALDAGETHVELLEPLGGAGPIAEFLAKRGEGVHHLCFEVESIEESLGRLREAGLTVIGEAPRAGAGGCRVAFLHPKSAGGVLIELSEKPR